MNLREKIAAGLREAKDRLSGHTAGPAAAEPSNYYAPAVMQYGATNTYENGPSTAAAAEPQLLVREGHSDCAFPNVAESARFAMKWGPVGFSHAQAETLLATAEGYWDVLTGPLGFDQSRGLHVEKRLTHKMNIYIAGTGLKDPGPGNGCYLGCDPEGIHYVSTAPDPQTMAHELGHLAQRGTLGFKDNDKVGWTWEACSDWTSWYFHPYNPPSCRAYLDRHNEPLDNFETRYAAWIFFRFLQERCGVDFVGRCWSAAEQDELPFAVIQRLLPQVPFPDVFADFASLCAAGNITPEEPQDWDRFTAVQRGADGRFTPCSRPLQWFGFNVIDLKALAPPGQHLMLEFDGHPFPQDWRTAIVTKKADGQVVRTPQIWGSAPQPVLVDQTDRQVLLVVCAAGRHDDSSERPSYSFAIRAVQHEWHCQRCTYMHSGAQAGYLCCAACGSPRPEGWR